MSDTTTIRGDEKGYNGWTNYETWNVALWINNDQGSENYWSEQAEEQYRNASADSTFTRRENARYSLAEQLKSEIEESNPLADHASMWSDLLSASLSEVNWQEIADGMFDSVDMAEIDAEDAEPELVTLRDFLNANPDKKIVIFYTSQGVPTGSYILPDNESWTTVSEWELWDLQGVVDSYGEWTWYGEGEPKDANRNTIRTISAYENDDKFDELMDENYGN